MSYRNILLGLSLLTICQWGYSQLKVTPDGHVGIGTNNPISRLHVYGEGLIDSHTLPWQSAFQTRVYNKNTSAYSLWNGYSEKEVFFVNGEGWMWSGQGAYIGTDSSLLQNRSNIQSPLESVMKLNGIRFNYVDGGKATIRQITIAWGWLPRNWSRWFLKPLRLCPIASWLFLIQIWSHCWWRP